MYKIIICIGLSSLLFGCTNISQPTASVKCVGEDWRALGLQAAKKLKSVRTFDEYVNACGTSLESTAKAAFVDGYAIGIIEVCNYGTGYDLGSTNQKYPDICPFEIQSEFQKGYLTGRREYQDKMLRLNKTSDDLEEIERNKRKIQEIQIAD
jgi:hypothetical protein